MCGIAGFFQDNQSITRNEQRQLAKLMCDVIEHRGPDDEGFYFEGGLAIGMRRLSIIDLSTGHQPISNEDGSIWIVFNGEIYNFQELRDDLLAHGHTFKTHTDTEVIVHLYEEEGERCVQRLRGMFGFAIWDSRERKLLLARDRVGKKPLHYAQFGDTFVFGSEIKSLLQHPDAKREVNPEAISDFLSFGYIPEPATAFRGIYKLPPGHLLRYQNDSIRTWQYWDFKYDSASDQRLIADEREYIERLRDLISESVRLRLVSEVPLGAFLSGGIDSSTVVGMMARATDRPVKTFSIGFHEESHNELDYARITARHFRTDHHEFIVKPDLCRLAEEIVWHHDEPFADSSSIPTYVVSKMAREQVVVVLSGDGGDEVFAGYERYAVDQRREIYQRIPRFIRSGLLMPLSRSLPRAAYGKNLLRNIALNSADRYIDSLSYFNRDAKHELLSASTQRNLARYDSTVAFRKLFDLPASSAHIERLMYLDSKTYLPEDILTKVDRMSMAHSIEIRAPLLDHKLIEFVETIPASLKLHGEPRALNTKYILKRAVADFIPPEILNRPKQGFGVPLRKWFNGDLREMLNDTLNDRRTRERGLFNERAITAIVDEHRRERRDNSTHLWGLLVLELWHRAFIDQRPAPKFSGAKAVSLDRLEASAG